MPLVVSEVGIREAFIPREGCCYIDADIEGLELNTLAQVEIWTINDRTKADQINSGKDLHCVTGSVIAGQPYDLFFRSAKVLEEKASKNIRNLAKVPNFGKPGGMADTTLISYARTSYGIKLAATPDNPKPCREEQETEAKRIGDHWRRANPHDQEYLNFIRTCRHGDRYRVIMGHPSIGNLIRRGGATYCAAANSLFQGLGAIAAGEITWLIQRACYTETASPLFGCRLVMHAYDEWMIEVPIGRQTEAAAELERLILLGGSRKVPDIGFRTEAVAMCAWAKNAKRVVRDGELLIWGTQDCEIELARQRAA